MLKYEIPAGSERGTHAPPPSPDAPSRTGCGVNYVLEGDKIKIDECDMEEFSTLGSSEKKIAVLGDGWRP